MLFNVVEMVVFHFYFFFISKDNYIYIEVPEVQRLQVRVVKQMVPNQSRDSLKGNQTE